jgi:hypothetical protein
LFRGGLWFGNGARDAGLTLMGARVVGGGGIVAAGLLAVVVGRCTGGRCCSMVVLTVAGDTGTG